MISEKKLLLICILETNFIIAALQLKRSVSFNIVISSVTKHVKAIILLADVAVRKRHQRQDKNLIFFTRTILTRTKTTDIRTEMSVRLIAMC